MAYTATSSEPLPPQGQYRANGQNYDAASGTLIGPEAAYAAQTKAYAPIVQGEQAIQDAAVDTQTQKDVMGLNKQASENTNKLAMMQGQKRVVGGGAFQARGINANSAIAGLSSANAKAVGEQKKKQIATTLATPTGQRSAIANYMSYGQGLPKATAP